MNTTPDTEPLGSAQRALELADELTSFSVLLSCLPEHTGYCGGVYVINDFERDEIVAALGAATAILRHYAEILPKWQAGLDVSTLEREDEFGTVGREEVL